MWFIDQQLQAGKRNFIFLGEAGSGKSEIAVNFARYLLQKKEKPVHFFDMDMTKPLFRSRDRCEELSREGICFHYEEQFMDAPTLVGGVQRALKDLDCYAVMDVGGDHIGARAIGGFISGIRSRQTLVYYVLNPYRPWSYDLEHVDGTLGMIQEASHIPIQNIHMINNPNIGITTTLEEVEKGARKMEEMISPYKSIDFLCVREEHYKDARERFGELVMPLHLYLQYPWMDGL